MKFYEKKCSVRKGDEITKLRNKSFMGPKRQTYLWVCEASDIKTRFFKTVALHQAQKILTAAVCM